MTISNKKRKKGNVAVRGREHVRQVVRAFTNKNQNAVIKHEVRIVPIIRNRTTKKNDIEDKLKRTKQRNTPTNQTQHITKNEQTQQHHKGH